MELSRYRRLFEDKQREAVNGLCGRIIRGTKPSDFITLTDDPNRKLVMLMGPDGLEQIMSQTGYEALVTIGYEPNYIVRKVVDEGNQFKLVVFAEGGEAKLATWENVVEIVGSVYPLALSPLYRSLNFFKNTSFEEIERTAEFNFAEVDKTGIADNRFMTYERFIAGNQNAIAAREFLYFTIHLRELFAGDGYTYDAQRNRGLMEYIVPNKPLVELGNYDLIDMSVSVPAKPLKNNTRRKSMNTVNIQMLIIDPQNDFMDMPQSTLPVNGAVGDMQRLARLIERVGKKLTDIHVTMDSHRLLDIAQPAWWVDTRGNNPAPFTIISVDDVVNGIWLPRNPRFRERSLAYVKALAQGGKYPLCIWPPHCLIGTWGHNVEENLNQALQQWSQKEFAMVDYVTKGSNPWTEHYGALMAEVPDPEDPTTMINRDFLNMLQQADIVAVAGEALSHCVKETVSQIADNIGDEHIKKFVILTDCCSPVGAVPGGPDFPAIAQEWLKEMEKKGMQLMTSDAFLR